MNTVHLQHNGTFQKDTVRNADRAYWKLIAKSYTQCWISMDDSIETTNAVSEVSCKVCLGLLGELTDIDENPI